MTKDAQKMMSTGARYLALGMEIVACISIGVFGGIWLDRVFSTSPILFWIGLAAGIGAVSRIIINVVREYKNVGV